MKTRLILLPEVLAFYTYGEVFIMNEKTNVMTLKDLKVLAE